jgi:hypothetical protein
MHGGLLAEQHKSRLTSGGGCGITTTIGKFVEVVIMQKYIRSLAQAAVAAAVLIAYVGCEATDDAGGSLSINPSSVTLLNASDRQIFTVGGSGISTGTNTTTTTTGTGTAAGGLQTLSLPLAWVVSNSRLGYILSSSGQQAVYVRTSATGVNTVTVRDQYGAQGYATVTQPSQDTGGGETLTLQADPNPIPSGSIQCTIRVVSGGTSPFTWNVGTGTQLSGGTTATITWQSPVTPGNYTVSVTDAEGHSGGITIVKQ